MDQAADQSSGLEPQSKGTNLRGVLDSYVALLGEEATQKLLDDLPPELTAALRNRTVLATSWYPLAWHRAIDAAIARRHGREFVRRVARHGMAEDLNTVYRILLKPFSVAYLISIAARTFSKYWSKGKMTVTAKGPGTVTVLFEECYGFDANVWEDQLGALLGGLDAFGVKNGAGAIRSGGGDGDSRAEMVLTWRP